MNSLLLLWRGHSPEQVYCLYYQAWALNTGSVQLDQQVGGVWLSSAWVGKPPVSSSACGQPHSPSMPTSSSYPEVHSLCLQSFHQTWTRSLDALPVASPSLACMRASVVTNTNHCFLVCLLQAAGCKGLAGSNWLNPSQAAATALNSKRECPPSPSSGWRWNFIADSSKVTSSGVSLKPLPQGRCHLPAAWTQSSAPVTLQRLPLKWIVFLMLPCSL